jgi:hypothetical protein
VTLVNTATGELGADAWVPRPGHDLVPDGWAEAIMVPWLAAQTEPSDLSSAAAQLDGLTAAYRTLNADTLELVKARRYLEVRWGELLGEPVNHGPSTAVDGSLTRDQRVAFRRLAENRRQVEDLLRNATDAEELSRAALQRAVKGSDPNGDEWFTPRWLFDALGVGFSIDVCSPEDRTYVSVPAERFFTETDDGLSREWHGTVWCNPPYSTPGPWAKRMVTHGDGLLLSHIPMNAEWCVDVWRHCDGIRLFQGMDFVRPDGQLERPGYWLQLAAFGDAASDALAGMDVPEDLNPRRVPSPMWKPL